MEDIRRKCNPLVDLSKFTSNKNILNNTRQKKKKSHAQDNIYVVRQFAYVHRVAGILLLSGKIQQCTRTLSRNPNPNYTLALSHKKNKNKSWLPLFSLFSLVRLLTRLIGITLSSISFYFFILPHIIKRTHTHTHTHIYIYIYQIELHVQGTCRSFVLLKKLYF